MALVKNRRVPRVAVGHPDRARDGVAYLYLLPGVVLILLFVVYPLIQTIQLSFTNWNGVTQAEVVGLHNYVQVFADPKLRSAFLHSFVLIIFFSFFPIIMGLLVTAVMARYRIRGMSIYRAILFIPQALSMVVVAVAWQWVFAPNGMLNQLLSLVGDDVNTAWLGSFTYALPAIGVTGSWRNIGLCMVLFLAGIQKIDGSLYEAAQLDGANAWQEFRYITLPGLRAEIAVALTLTVTAALKSFDVVYLMTNGGPGYATTVPGYEVFARAFNRGQVGSAATVGIVLAILIFVVNMGIQRYRKEKS